MVPPQLGQGGLQLAWSGPAGFSHRVQLAREPAFDRPELDQVVAGSRLLIAEPQPGTLHVRTQVLLPDGSAGPWSAAQRFEVPKKELPAPAFPWPLLLILLLPLL